MTDDDKRPAPDGFLLHVADVDLKFPAGPIGKAIANVFETCDGLERLTVAMTALQDLPAAMSDELCRRFGNGHLHVALCVANCQNVPATLTFAWIKSTREEVAPSCPTSN